MIHSILLILLTLLPLVSVAPVAKFTITGTVTCERFRHFCFYVKLREEDRIKDDQIGKDGIHCTPLHDNQFIITGYLRGDEVFSDKYGIWLSNSHNCTENGQKLWFRTITKYWNITEPNPTYHFDFIVDDVGQPVDNYE
ncbi:unnamed protein product [Caenorhabditis brenneri]